MSDEKTNQSINGYFTKQAIACRLSEDTVALIDENYEMITGDIKPVTDRKLVENMLDLALSKVKPGLDAKKQIEQLTDKLNTLSNENASLTNKINELSMAHEEEIGSLRERLTENDGSFDLEIAQLHKVIDDQKQRILILEAELTAQQSADALLIDLLPAEKTVIADLAANESKAVGKLITPAMLLKNVIFFILKNGPHDVFHSEISISRIKQLMAPKTPPDPNNRQ